MPVDKEKTQQNATTSLTKKNRHYNGGLPGYNMNRRWFVYLLIAMTTESLTA